MSAEQTLIFGECTELPRNQYAVFLYTKKPLGWLGLAEKGVLLYQIE